MRKTTTLLALGTLLSGGGYAQTWDQIYTYDVQEAIWDKPRVAVSADNIIMVGMETIRSGRKLERSTDGGQNWTTISNDFQSAYMGFDSNNNLYLVNEKKNQGVSTNYMDSLWYSNDGGATIQAVDDIIDNGVRKENFYISADNDFYTVVNGAGTNLEQQLGTYNNGQQTGTLNSPFSVGSSSLRGIIKLANGNLVTSSYNDGVHYSTDGGTTWTASSNDDVIGTSTFTSFAEANNGTLFLAGVSLKQCTDGGETWTNAPLTLNWVSHVKKSGNGNLYAIAVYSSPLLYESTDNGATWVGIQNDPGTGIQEFAVSNDYLYAIYNDNNLYRTAITGNSTGIETVQTAEVQIFPNPTNGDVNVNLTGSHFAGITIQLIDATGRTVYQTTANSPLVTLPGNAFNNPGFYVVSCTNAQGDVVSTTKLIRTE